MGVRVSLHPRGPGFNPHPDPGLNVLEVSRKAVMQLQKNECYRHVFRMWNIMGSDFFLKLSKKLKSRKDLKFKSDTIFCLLCDLCNAYSSLCSHFRYIRTLQIYFNHKNCIFLQANPFAYTFKGTVIQNQVASTNILKQWRCIIIIITR